jgi:hypothetical protein
MCGWAKSPQIPATLTVQFISQLSHCLTIDAVNLIMSKLVDQIKMKLDSYIVM